jgi:hypothetical protein
MTVWVCQVVGSAVAERTLGRAQSVLAAVLMAVTCVSILAFDLVTSYLGGRSMC